MSKVTTEMILEAKTEADVLEKFKELDDLSYGKMANIIWDLKSRLDRALEYIGNSKDQEKLYKRINKMDNLLESIKDYVDFRIKDFRK